MQIEVHSGSLDFSHALRDHVQERIEHALRHAPWDVTRVEVFFNDHNGPKRGDDKTCRAEVRVAGRAPWVVSAHDDDLYKAATKVATKVRKRLNHRIDRMIDRRRRQPIADMPL